MDPFLLTIKHVLYQTRAKRRIGFYTNCENTVTSPALRRYLNTWLTPGKEETSLARVLLMPLLLIWLLNISKKKMIFFFRNLPSFNFKSLVSIYIYINKVLTSQMSGRDLKLKHFFVRWMWKACSTLHSRAPSMWGTRRLQASVPNYCHDNMLHYTNS